MGLRKTIFGRSKGSTLKIGGVATLYPNIATLAAKINVTQNRIKKFIITGNDIEALITGGNYSPSVFTDITQLTYFEEVGGYIKKFNGTHYFFRGCTNLIYVKIPELQVLGPSAFGNCVNIETIELPKLITIDNFVTNDGIAVFQNCNKLKILNFPDLQTFNNSYAMAGLTALLILNIPKCTRFGRTTGNDFCLTNVKLGLKITANIFLKTCNLGQMDGDLLYAETSRGAIINFVN